MLGHGAWPFLPLGAAGHGLARVPICARVNVLALVISQEWKIGSGPVPQPKEE